MTVYIPTDSLVEAMQFDGENIREIEEFANVFVCRTNSSVNDAVVWNGTDLIVMTEEKPRKLAASNWVVRLKCGKLDVYHDLFFKSVFTENTKMVPDSAPTLVR